MTIQNDLKLLDEWLILSAIQKAKSVRDNYNLDRFKAYLKGKIHNAQRTDLNYYLFNTENGIKLDVAVMKKELKQLRIEVKND